MANKVFHKANIKTTDATSSRIVSFFDLNKTHESYGAQFRSTITIPSGVATNTNIPFATMSIAKFVILAGDRVLTFRVLSSLDSGTEQHFVGRELILTECTLSGIHVGGSIYGTTVLDVMLVGD